MIAGPELVAKAREAGVEMRSKKTRTGPLPNKSPEEAEKLGLREMQQALSELVGRDVDFMIYESEEAALARAPGIVVPKE